MNSKIWICVLFIFMGMAFMTIDVSATNKSADEAILWVQSNVGKSIDKDGYYGAQCVDLIMAYYEYLGVSRVAGNGKDYATNYLPSGWNRIRGAQPQKGDVLIYTTGDWGHVAIYESDSVTYHQNFGGQYVRKISGRYDSVRGGYWGVIRPNFANGDQDPKYDFNSVSGEERKVYIRGWAFDPDKSSDSLAIHVYVGGVFAGSFGADKYREDVNNAYGISGNHGFEEYVYTDKVGSQLVEIYTFNANDGSPRKIWSGNVNINYDSPRGAIDSIKGGDGQVSVRGWTFDLDDSKKSLTIHVYVGGPAGAEGAEGLVGTADVQRDDVNSSYGISGKHGYNRAFKTTKRGEQDVYIYAINVGKGENIELGHSKVVIKEPANTQYNYIIPDGDYLITSGLDSNKCIDLSGGLATDGQRVEIHSINGGLNQVWHVEKRLDGYYKLTNKKSGTVLDVDGGALANQTKIQGFSSNDTDAQKWVIKEADDGKYYYLTAKCNALNIDVLNADTTDGHQLVVNQVNTSLAQKWRFVPYTDNNDNTIADGDYHIVSYGEPSYGLDLYENDTSDGNYIGIWKNTDDERQVFTVKYLGNGYYSIIHKESGKAVDVAGGKGKNDQNIILYHCNQSDAQQWLIRPAKGIKGGYSIQTKCGGFLLNTDLPKEGTYTKTNLQSHYSNNTSGVGAYLQTWKFIPTEKQTVDVDTTTDSISFSWNKLSWATSYDLIIKDSDGKDYSSMGLTKTKLSKVLANGSYSAYVVFKCSNYSSESDTCDFTVSKKSLKELIDDSIEFSDRTCSYSTSLRSLSISGELPEGVVVEYDNNEKKDAGTYNVKARFIDSSTGVLITTKTATLTIAPIGVGKSCISDVADQVYTGFGLEPVLNIVKKLSYFDDSMTYNKTEYVLQKDIDYSVTYENNVNAGIATAKISYMGNYKGSTEISFNICKADYDMSNVFFNDAEYNYDGKTKTISVSGSLPEGVNVTYDNNQYIDAGEYEVVASFEGDANHNTIAEMKAKLKISKANNEWIDNLRCDNISVGTLPRPYAKAKEGLVYYMYSDSANGTYRDAVPTEVGDYYVKAFVNPLLNYNALQSTAIKFSITDSYKHVCEWDEGKVSISPTCVSTGIRTFKCKDEGCNEIKTEIIPATGIHCGGKTVIENVVEPSCTNFGSYDEVLYCTECNKELNRSTRINNPLGHTVASAVKENVVKPTCCDAGSYEEVIYCSKCGDEISRTKVEINPLGHIWGEWIVVKSPTQEEEGLEQRKCVNDPSHTETRAIPKLVNSNSDSSNITSNSSDESLKNRENEDNNLKEQDNNKNTDSSDMKQTNIQDNVDKDDSSDSAAFDADSEEQQCNVGEELKDVKTNTTYVVTYDEDDEYKVEYKSIESASKNVIVPDSVEIGGVIYDVTSIADEAFKNDKTIKTISIGKNVESIGDSSFEGCTKLTKVKISNSVTEVGDSAFKGCTKLTSVSIPKSVLSIGDYAFSGCKSLKKVSIGKNVEEIGENAFAKCKSLESITIPANVETIGNNAFSGATKLKTIIIKTTKLTSKTVSKDVFRGITSKTVIKVPKAKKSAYKILLRKKGLPKTVKIKAI